MIASRIEITLAMLREALKTIIVEKEASRATTKWEKKKVLTSRVHNMRLPFPWDHWDDQLVHNVNPLEVEHLTTQITQSIKSLQHELIGSRLKHNQGGDWELSKFLERRQRGERGSSLEEDGIKSSQCDWEVDVWNLVKVMKILPS